IPQPQLQVPAKRKKRIEKLQECPSTRQGVSFPGVLFFLSERGSLPAARTRARTVLRPQRAFAL
ncbi:MAG: hypothetical protein IJH05_02015, partial [Firmicutes bacterium]|nr:hypothetical protein [Bacillota bacterium]